MGAVSAKLIKVKSSFTEDSHKKKESFFEQNERVSYTKQVGKKCLQRMVDIVDLGQSNSLKKMFKYLNPALKYIMYCKQQNMPGQQNLDVSIGQNYVRIHEQELINSAGTVLQMYCEYLRKVVPANMSFFHFMRENDLYIHYCTLKYVLEAGNAGTLFRASGKSINVFNRLKTQTRILYIKLISHWLYDMIKYKCSAISLQSSTLPYLIVISGALLCGLVANDKINYLEECSIREKNKAEKLQVYQHCLYSFTFLLSQAHSDKKNKSIQGNGCIQLVLLGIMSLINTMWKDMPADESEETKSKVMFAPSYWFAESIGFVKDPTLENLIFLLVLDLIRRTKQQQYAVNDEVKVDKNSNQPAPTYQIFDDEHEQQNNNADKQQQKFSKHKQSSLHQQKVMTNNSQVLQVDSQNLMKVSDVDLGKGFNKYSPFNKLTQLMLYSCLKGILHYFQDSVDIEILQMVLSVEIADMELNSLLRPYILEIIDKIQALSHLGHEQYRSRKPINILLGLKQFREKNRINYSTENYIIPYKLVGTNCTLMIHNLTSKILLSYNGQVEMDDGDIWREIFKWNVDKMECIQR